MDGELTTNDTQLQCEFNFESVPEALNKLASGHPEIFEELQFVEEARPDQETALPDMSPSERFGDSTDNIFTWAMEQWEEKQLEDGIETWDYSHLLNNEVRK